MVAVSVLNVKSAVVKSGSENMVSAWKLAAGRAMPLGCTSALDRTGGGVQVETPGLRSCLWCTWGQAGSEALQMSIRDNMIWIWAMQPTEGGDNTEKCRPVEGRNFGQELRDRYIVICGA